MDGGVDALLERLLSKGGDFAGAAGELRGGLSLGHGEHILGWVMCLRMRETA